MFEVGKTYTAANGTKFECIVMRDGRSWLISSANSPAYVWSNNGVSLSLSDEYNITFDPRDQEIADLKTRIAVLTAIVQADEYTIPVADNSIWYDHTDDSIHVRRAAVNPLYGYHTDTTVRG